MSRNRAPRGVEGFVLAGGTSSRFGSNKALASWNGRTLIVHALDALRKLGLNPRVVCTDPAPYGQCASAFVLSERPNRGPAEAVRAAMASTDADWSLVLSADMPGVNADLLRVLIASAERAAGDPPAAVCFADAQGRRHPFPGLYACTGIAELEGSDSGVAMQRFLDAIEARFLGPESVPAGIDLDTVLRNVNRPEDLQNPLPHTPESN